VNEPHANELHPAHLGKNRIEALTDGIYAVAMTLLVIDLKVPEHQVIHGQTDLSNALLALLPKVGAWLISFFILAIFWIGHHRLYQHVRVVDMKLLWRNIQQLLLVSLFPFSASLVGTYGDMLEAQYIYNGHMILLSALMLAQIVRVRRTPALQSHPFKDGAYHAALLRHGGLAGAAAIAIVVGACTGSVLATYAYLLMWPLGYVSRRIAARDLAPADATTTQASGPPPTTT
jgi:uncharacterized membrane protein